MSEGDQRSNAFRIFLLELLTRLKVIGLADERSFRMPLTQELIGDALGLRVPHVNRTLRQLRYDELVSIEEHLVIIKDVEALSASWSPRTGGAAGSPSAS
jgi:CRP-like cAMP-binding protein